MATTQKAAAPKAAKKSQGFTGIRGAFWIIVVCFIAAVCIFNLVLGNESNFQGNNSENGPLNILGTIYKGGVVVPVIHTLLLTVLCLSVERWLALKTAFGKGSLTKFVANTKAALKANDFAKAEDLCNKMQGSVANVVVASLHAYKDMESGANAGLKKSQKVAKIQQAHEEATQLEMPTLQMNLPIIATIVTLGTLTGLLGTVTGMIKSFQALAAGGGGDSLALSTGISEALINTAFGIATSWCAVISYNFFTNKIDKLTYALDEVGYSIAQTYEANHTDEA
ncbi:MULTISPECIES: MotA/TolQ/ExbB proton channel family protein [Prevotellaceae]|uniref:Biopolymer transport protein n=2 Tax=Prevotellaceae TaxID=171552 RepID=F9D0V5_PREDD|nr:MULTISPECIES: MotA/TolQ/ExbB proton channel family protein [Prevotellaceae]AGB27680.1 biopolymer transport protein [Prevotella dentalis DSM 3688]EGQ16634.1 MotA/TolQ/ExbB proton channel family protein [Prevotella dentalis DSM 3688]